MCSTDISSEHSLRTCTQVRRNVRKSDVVYACKKKKKNATEVTIRVGLRAAESSSHGRHPCAHRLFLPKESSHKFAVYFFVNVLLNAFLRVSRAHDRFK